jgi:exopolyphosphatase / guanosine-5'-triphosphate,3'-diphosphate pyrophosphatase
VSGRDRVAGLPSAGRAVVTAAADLGSTSVHVLVAVVRDHGLEPLLDESAFLGLGAAMDARGYLGAAATAELAATLVRYTETARRLGAGAITFIGTEPLRRAADAAGIVHAVERSSGAPLHVLEHEEEALLTLLGVTEGRPVETEIAVVDIGGGSSELVILDPGGVPSAVGCRLGASSLTTRHVVHDPPTLGEVAAMRAAARAAVAVLPDARPAELVAVGGTASNLVRVLPAATLDRVLTRQRIEDALAVLATEPAAVASERHRVRPARARLLPAGAVILDSFLERYGLAALRVSEAGIREGAVLATSHAGINWRDQLPRLARGWRP